MAFFSRSSAEQSRIVDKVQDAIKKLGNVTLGDGKLTAETGLDARSILASVILLDQERKIVVQTGPKAEFLITGLEHK
jgi:hypothetical protein